MHNNGHVNNRVQELDTPTTTCTTGTSSTLSMSANCRTSTVFCTVTTKHLKLHSTGTSTTFSKNCTQPRLCMSTGTSTTVDELHKNGTSTTLSALQLRNVHSFLHCQPQAPVVVQQRVKSTLSKSWTPRGNMRFLHDLWHDATICSICDSSSAAPGPKKLSSSLKPSSSLSKGRV